MRTAVFPSTWSSADEFGVRPGTCTGSAATHSATGPCLQGIVGKVIKVSPAVAPPIKVPKNGVLAENSTTGFSGMATLKISVSSFETDVPGDSDTVES
mgnify:FL=1